MNQQQRGKKSRRVRTQHTFYPCPPPSELEAYDDDSDDEFIDYNAVSAACFDFLSVFACIFRFGTCLRQNHLLLLFLSFSYGECF